ncbi:hypothetical protein BKA81DRAFT_24434 [Phyllosticta paracitricarpa]
MGRASFFPRARPPDAKHKACNAHHPPGRPANLPSTTVPPRSPPIPSTLPPVTDLLPPAVNSSCSRLCRLTLHAHPRVQLRAKFFRSRSKSRSRVHLASVSEAWLRYRRSSSIHYDQVNNRVHCFSGHRAVGVFSSSMSHSLMFGQVHSTSEPSVLHRVGVFLSSVNLLSSLIRNCKLSGVMLSVFLNNSSTIQLSEDSSCAHHRPQWAKKKKDSLWTKVRQAQL